MGSAYTPEIDESVEPQEEIIHTDIDISIAEIILLRIAPPSY